eukprot:364750-Chlamydomonas_euryale.AAC.11
MLHPSCCNTVQRHSMLASTAWQSNLMKIYRKSSCIIAAAAKQLSCFTKAAPACMPPTQVQ